jgi:hypothetical protein
MLLAACAPDTGELSFDGVQSARWDGGHGLRVGWERARGGNGVMYRVELTNSDGELAAYAETPDRSAHFAYLPNGIYTVRVQAVDDRGRRDGSEASLDQKVGENRLVYRGEFPLEGAMDVWGDGDVVAVAGGLNTAADVVLLDAWDTVEARELARIDGLGQVRDVHIQDDLLFAASDCNCELGDSNWDAWDGIGARIWDVADPTAPVLLAEIGLPDASVHNLVYAEGFLYLTSLLEGTVGIYDVREPEAPEKVATWAPSVPATVHDQTWADGALYVAYGSGFARVDVSDPGSPTTVFEHEVEDASGFAAVHNVWPTAAGDYLAMTQERIGGRLSVWDIRDPGGIAQVWEWPEEETNCAHNAYIAGDVLWVAWYLDGVRAFDLADPTAPVLTGWYDTYPADFQGLGNVPVIEGAWGVWPFGEHVVLGDTERGAVFFDWFPVEVSR